MIDLITSVVAASSVDLAFALAASALVDPTFALAAASLVVPAFALAVDTSLVGLAFALVGHTPSVVSIRKLAAAACLGGLLLRKLARRDAPRQFQRPHRYGAPQ